MVNCSTTFHLCNIYWKIPSYGEIRFFYKFTYTIRFILNKVLEIWSVTVKNWVHQVLNWILSLLTVFHFISTVFWRYFLSDLRTLVRHCIKKVKSWKIKAKREIEKKTHLPHSNVVAVFNYQIKTSFIQ